MARTNEEQKRIECWFLARAREAGIPIPPGEIPGEEPDFRFQTGCTALGIELSEVLRPECSNYGILPVAEESVHREIIEGAQKLYYASSNATPVHVRVWFSSTRGKKHDKRKLAAMLKEFVLSNVQRATPVASFSHPSALELLKEPDKVSAPEGFYSVHLDTQLPADGWSSGEAGGITISDIRPVVEARIAGKDKLLETYRANLPQGAQVWLLLYTSVTVSRSMPIPLDAEEWRIPSRFDRIFWFASLERQFVEIRRVAQ